MEDIEPSRIYNFSLEHIVGVQTCKGTMCKLQGSIIGNHPSLIIVIFQDVRDNIVLGEKSMFI
jgi:hypothetical protein